MRQVHGIQQKYKVEDDSSEKHEDDNDEEDGDCSGDEHISVKKEVMSEKSENGIEKAEESGKFICEYCDRELENNLDLQRHTKQHIFWTMKS